MSQMNNSATLASLRRAIEQHDGPPRRASLSI